MGISGPKTRVTVNSPACSEHAPANENRKATTTRNAIKFIEGTLGEDRRTAKPLVIEASFWATEPGVTSTITCGVDRRSTVPGPADFLLRGCSAVLRRQWPWAIWRQTFSEPWHALTHSFMIWSSCPSHAAAQSRQASAHAWWAYLPNGLLRAINVAVSTQNAWQSIAAWCDLAW